LAAINHEAPDRVPTDIWATAEVWAMLREHFGQGADIRELLHIDGMAGVDSKYIGPPLPTVAPDETVDYWGIRTKQISYGTGVYDEMFYHPLSYAQTVEDLESYMWPAPSWFDYSGMRSSAESLRGDRVVTCGYMAIFFQHNKLRGLKASLLDPLVRPEFTRHLLNGISDFLYEHHRRMFEACDGLIDLTEVTDDLGTQVGPMISPSTFRKFYRPHMQRFIDLAHSFGIKVFHHDDGAIRPFIPDLVEMGIDVLNPLQWTCPGMELEGLKRDFGHELCFHGGVDNQRVLAFGTTEEVRAEVRHCIDALTGDGTGYILAPCHNIQTLTPVGRIVAMYDEAYKYGVF
jgi:uroporphyrinogen decarboxylase